MKLDLILLREADSAMSILTNFRILPFFKEPQFVGAWDYSSSTCVIFGFLKSIYFYWKLERLVCALETDEFMLVCYRFYAQSIQKQVQMEEYMVGHKENKKGSGFEGLSLKRTMDFSLADEMYVMGFLDTVW